MHRRRSAPLNRTGDVSLTRSEREASTRFERGEARLGADHGRGRELRSDAARAWASVTTILAGTRCSWPRASATCSCSSASCSWSRGFTTPSTSSCSPPLSCIDMRGVACPHAGHRAGAGPGGLCGLRAPGSRHRLRRACRFPTTNGEPVLTDVSFTAREGEVTALVGPVGIGQVHGSEAGSPLLGRGRGARSPWAAWTWPAWTRRRF